MNSTEFVVIYGYNTLLHPQEVIGIAIRRVCWLVRLCVYLIR